MMKNTVFKSGYSLINIIDNKDNVELREYAITTALNSVLSGAVKQTNLGVGKYNTTDAIMNNYRIDFEEKAKEIIQKENYFKRGLSFLVRKVGECPKDKLSTTIYVIYGISKGEYYGWAFTYEFILKNSTPEMYGQRNDNYLVMPIKIAGKPRDLRSLAFELRRLTKSKTKYDIIEI